MRTYPLRTRQWTRAQYDRLIEIGVLVEDDPIELVGGELVIAEPQGSQHYTATVLAAESLRGALGEGWLVRVLGPLGLDSESEPEPDVSVVPGTARDYHRAHPTQPALVVEVSASRSRLTFDRAHKGSLYARARVPDYWIVNLLDAVLEVYREPVEDPAAAFGWRYASREVLRPEAVVAPLAVPTAQLLVRDLLP